MEALSGARSVVAIVALVGALGFASRGGGDEAAPEATTFAAEDVVAAFEEGAGGYSFEKTITLVEDGATAYAPVNSADPTELAPLTGGLGEGSIVWQVVVFEGADPPLDADAAKAVAFASKKFEEAEPGIFLGDSDIGYVARGNVVIDGPVLDGDLADDTLVGWKAVLDGL